MISLKCIPVFSEEDNVDGFKYKVNLTLKIKHVTSVEKYMSTVF